MNETMYYPLSRMEIRGAIPNHCFGMVRNGGAKAHQGWDLLASVGTTVYAIADGTIVDVRYDEKYWQYDSKAKKWKDVDGYGFSMLLEFALGGKTYFAFYSHLSSVGREKGARVTAGAAIGYTGRSGNASRISLSEAHLHFEIRDTRYVGGGLEGRIDPADLLGAFSICP